MKNLFYQSVQAKSTGGYRGKKATRGFISILSIALILAIVISFAQGIIPGFNPTSRALAASNPAPVQIFYITLPEANALTILNAINSDAVTPVTTYFSLAIGVSGTKIYYDQWENGYDVDIANPTNLYSTGNPGGTQIWGNGEADDGCAPNKGGNTLTCSDANDVFVAGDVVIPSNSIPIPRDSSTILFDARDKVGASSLIAMARATWASVSGTLNAFAHEMYATAEWGTAYESPVGTNTSYPAQGYTGQGMFEYAALSIMASHNDTVVQIDANANGTYETSVTLMEGNSYLATGIAQGARVQTTDADKPIQVVLLTGDIDSNYETRDMNLLPVSSYGTRYWSPVGVNTDNSDTANTGPTRLFLYNPSGNTSMTFTCTTRTGSSTSGSIAARGIWYFNLTSNQAAYCTASQPFFAIGTVDTPVENTSAGQAWDWSFTLYPDNLLTTDALVGLGLGKDPTDTTSNQNGSPLWVTTAVCPTGVTSTYVYVDWNNDGTADRADLNGDGDTGDTPDGISEGTSNNGMLISQLYSVRLFEPGLDEEEFDQSGARVWSRTASGAGTGGTPGCNLALAWGQDPRTASAASPGLDVGTAVAPLRRIEITKLLELKTDADGDGVLSPGDTASYLISIKNTGNSSIASVYLYDTVPAHTDYVPGSTQKNIGPGWVSIPDDGTGTAFPLDVSGGALLGGPLNAGATFYARFDITLRNIAQEGVYDEITNCATANTSGGNVRTCTINLVASNDWVDLPDTYSTSFAANGPRHSESVLKLGVNFDRELQGQPSSGADGDDANQTTLPKADDEDGVTITGGATAWNNGTGSFQVTVSGASGCLNAWMDFTNDAGAVPPAADGNFTKTGGYDTYSTYSEHIIQNVAVSQGTTTIPVTVPSGLVAATNNLYYARFRLSPTCGTIAPTGFVSGGEVEDYIFDMGRLSSATLGDRIWLDEDSDGVQDAGEAGIANVKVTATWAGPDGNLATPGDNVTYTTWTDSEGAYIFTNLNGGTYQVTVDTTTLADGLEANPTYDYDGTSTAHTATLTLATGSEFTQADFGYNWSPTGDVTGNTGTGAIGDRIWIDADGDGKQDPGEPGLGGVTVTLYHDPDGNGVYDTVYATTTTAGDGSYIFDNLPAGAYTVGVTTPANYTQTGDPDQPGEPCGLCDGKTTAPVILGPGDVYVNADFGYQPNSGYSGTIGDLVWLDADADGTKDASEPGIAGVSVALIRDTNGNGAWDAGEPIISTTTTSSTGAYAFTGVPITDGVGSDDYLVWVNDTNNVLGSMTPTYDSNGTGTPDISSVANLASTGNLLQDFGYKPTGQTTSTAMIGDTIFLDRDNDGAADIGEGLEGVIVRLYNDTNADGNYDSNESLRAVATTDENGNYYFPGLPAGNYVVVVDTGTLPLGLSNTYDPDTTDSPVNESGVTLTAGQINLLQDFGYQGNNSISGTIWTDTDADGYMDASEVEWLAGVTVVLRDGNGDIVATATTDASGNYSFSYLPNGQYTVDVTDGNNVLDGYWHSLGTANTDGYSQVDPLTVTLTGGTSITYADFGYYRDPAGLGDRVWFDADADGIQDAGEAGLAGVQVTLTIEYPDGTISNVITTTDASGYYSFANLLQDENYDGVGTAGSGGVEPKYTISVAEISGYQPTMIDMGANDAVDSDNPKGVVSTVIEGATDLSYDFGFRGTGSIGDRIWLDENSDGVQDAGETGIANVKVTLTGTTGGGSSVSLTTYTDVNGNYIFPNLPPGSYTVTVDQTTLPVGLAANPTYDENGIGTPHTSTVTLSASEEHVTADFGYNWSTTGDVTGNTGTGAIGDRVWVDADGDGDQDPGEPGLGGVTVTLYHDPDLNGVYDTVYATTTTAADGTYIFDGLPAGSYVVNVTSPLNYTQTGDPDQAGVPCTVCDNKTTSPVVLAPGDVYVNADFGYMPVAGYGAIIGDKVWLDADADMVQDGTEPGIPGVSVALIKDSNENGVWDVGEPIIATTITDANGLYQFTGVPVTDGDGSDDYLVWVNDTSNVLGNLSPTYDNNGIASADISAVADLAPAGNYDQDFGYTPAGQTTTTGLIGDTIYLDRDGSGDYDAGEGLEGVTVRLYSDTNGDGNYDAGEPLRGTTVTDENGNYYFAHLPAGNYVVMVDTGSLPAGLTNTVDPDTSDSPLNESGVTLTAGEINLQQDFGYDGTNSVSGTLWKDVDADGFMDGTETTWLAGVTVVLRDSNGDIVATTTTDSSGNYSFNNLPDGTYTVDVTDENNVIDGYWHSQGTANTDGYSQSDPLTVSLTGGTNITYADFGYYRDPAALGNWVWYDADGLGIQQTGEAGLPNIEVTLTITYPDATIVTVTTVTDNNGYYSFGNLLLDEQMDGVGSGEPTFSISVTIPEGYYQTLLGQGSDIELDANDANGVIATVTEGMTVNNIDFGFDSSPTSVTVSDVVATIDASLLPELWVRISWSTMTEVDLYGFNVYRSTLEDGSDRVKLNADFILAQFPGSMSGGDYEYIDTSIQVGTTYYYWVEVVEVSGTVDLLIPALYPVGWYHTFLPVIHR